MRLALALLLLLLLAGPARAAPGELEPPALQVEAGLTGDETVRTGWSPFEVVLTAGGTPLELVVELAVGESSDALAAGQGWRCERSVTLAPGQRRRLWFIAPIRVRRWGLTYRVGVRTAGEAPRELAVAGPRSLSVEPRGQQYYNYSRLEARTAVLVVSDSPEPRDVDWLSRERRRDHAGPPRLGIRPPASLPELVAAYDAVDLVVVRDADLSAMSPAQADALVTWVEDGGRVLLVPPHDPAWFGERTVARLVEGRRARIAEGSRLPPLTASDGTRLPAPQVSPLVLEGAAALEPDLGNRLRPARPHPPGAASWLQGLSRGRGEVWVLAADVGRDPFMRWPGADVLGAAITGNLPPRPSGAAREPEVTVDAMQAVSVRDAPARWLVIGLVLVYVVVVGPLNDRLLRRRGALLLLVATIPAVALAWTLLVFSVGWATKGLSTVTRRVTLVSVRQGETLARERTIVGLRAASAAEYEVAFGPGLHSYQLERPYEQRVDRDRVASDEAQGQRHRVPLRLWSQAAFDAEGLRRLRGPVRVTRVGGVTTLDNGTELALDAAVAVGREGFLAGGPAPAGGRVTLAPSSPLGAQALQEALEGHLRARIDGSGALLELALRLGAHPQDVPAVSSLLQELGVTPGGSEPPVVVARLAAPPSVASVDGRERADRELLLLVAHPPRREAE